MWLPGQECTDFSNCDTRALVAPGTWNLNSAGMLILTVSPALAGRFLSTLPAGKSLVIVLNTAYCVLFYTYFAILIHTFYGYLPGASQVALVVKNPPANAGDIRSWVRSLGWEDPLELGNPMHRGAWKAKSREASDLPCMCAHTRITNPRSEVK